MDSSNTDREKLINDANFDLKVPYSYNNLLTNLEAVNKDLDNLNPYQFLTPIFEYTKAFQLMGSALSMAFSDITEKVGIWRDLFKDNYPNLRTMQEVMLKEGELKIQELNGENNSKLGQKKGMEYAKYTSGTRTIIRLSWFLKFMHEMFTEMIETNDSFSKIVKKSYEKALAPHHSWLVKQAAGVALSFAPSKRELPAKVFFGTFDY